jgi:hypothetical protein
VPSPAAAPLRLITEGQMITCDAVFVIECGHDSDAGGFDGPVLIPGAVVLSCTLDPGHGGELHHDIEGLWWREDG